MRYLLMVYGAESSWSAQEREECMVESTELCHKLKEQGHYLMASPLHPVSTATSVRIREGKRLVTDGPFAETHEQLGGFYLVEAHNLDQAIEIAARIPGASKGTIEVRPIVELPNLPVTAS